MVIHCGKIILHCQVHLLYATPLLKFTLEYWRVQSIKL